VKVPAPLGGGVGGEGWEYRSSGLEEKARRPKIPLLICCVVVVAPHASRQVDCIRGSARSHCPPLGARAIMCTCR
jgi:hypothetical protein